MTDDTMVEVVARAMCDSCGVETSFPHDHRTDNTGLDDGPDLYPPRRKPTPKPAEVTMEIRARAWATRRVKYGSRGHR